MKNKAEFKLWISQFDSDVINSYPQKVVSVKNKFFFREVVIQNISSHEDFEMFDFPKEKGERAMSFARWITIYHFSFSSRYSSSRYS